MATVLNRVTKQLIRSVNTPDYDPLDWIHNPDLSAVSGFDSIYWVITGDVVTLMNLSARDAVDAAILAQQTTDIRDATHDPMLTGLDEIGMRIRALIELFNKRDNYLTNRIAELQTAMDGMKASTGNVSNLRDAIPTSWLATNTRSRANAIQDFRDDINAGNVDSGE